MATYAVYCTRWDDPHVIEQIPARGLEFSMPLSDHGSCRFSATVEPGGGTWRAATAPIVSGVLVTSDGVPVWDGWLVGESESGPRTFDFHAVEWGSFFARVPAQPYSYLGWDAIAMFTDVIARAVAVQGQDPRVTMGIALGVPLHWWEVGKRSRGPDPIDRAIQSWDTKMVASFFEQIGEAEGGPEWYFASTGTLDDPVRALAIADHLGAHDPVVLEYVEDTQAPVLPGAPPRVTLLGDLFPAGTSVSPLVRRGGNVLAKARTRRSDTSATQAIAVGEGETTGQKRSTKPATVLLDAGWPRITRVESYRDISTQSALDAAAAGDLAASAGVVTGYSLATLDGDPVWQQVPRGSAVRVILDTDVYGGPRPYTFETRVLNTTVRVPDDGPAQVQWDVSEVLET